MNKPSIGRSGFTLVELLVAVTTSAVLILILASLLQAVGGATQTTGGRIEAEREARAAFEMLERDLAASVRRGGEWIHVLNDPDPLATGGAPQWLMFLASPLDHDRSTPGDVCVVSYRTGHEPLPGEDDPFPSLHRLVVPADVTYDSALGRASLDSAFFSETAPFEEASRSLDSWLAAGVIDIQVRGWVEGKAYDLTARSRLRPEQNLDAIEVTLEVLTKRGQRLFGNLAPSELRKRHTYRFTRIIQVPLAKP